MSMGKLLAGDRHVLIFVLSSFDYGIHMGQEYRKQVPMYLDLLATTTVPIPK